MHLIKRSKPSFQKVDLKVSLYFRPHGGNAVELTLFIRLLNSGLIICHIAFQLSIFLCKRFLRFLELFLLSFFPFKNGLGLLLRLSSKLLGFRNFVYHVTNFLYQIFIISIQLFSLSLDSKKPLLDDCGALIAMPKVIKKKID